MFTQPCFIRKNSKEIAKELQNLGYYTYHVEEYEDAPSDWCTVTEIEANYAGIWNNEPKGEYAKRCICCGTNEQLFIAIAALSDDTDKNQWFVMDSEVYLNINKGDWFKATDMNGGFHVGTQIDPLYCHKATVEELIEHFKDK